MNSNFFFINERKQILLDLFTYKEVKQAPFIMDNNKDPR